MPTPANSLLAIIVSLGKHEVNRSSFCGLARGELYGTPAATRL
jgi:hypothetical protein